MNMLDPFSRIEQIREIQRSNGIDPDSYEASLGGIIDSAYNDYVAPVIDEIKTGAKNWWYKLTGQEEKTSTYQAQIQRENELLDRQEAREDSAMQRGVADAIAAGLSKYSAVPATSGSYRTGVSGQSDPIGSLGKIQQLQANALGISEERHNLEISKKLGIRTDDPNYASKWSTLGNVLFGFDPAKVEGGVIPYVFQKIGAFFEKGSSGDGDSPSAEHSTQSPDDWVGSFHFSWEKNALRNSIPFSEALAGATYDQLKHVKTEVSKLRGLDDQQKSEMMSDIIKSVSPAVGKERFRSDQIKDTLDSAIGYAVSQMKMKGDSDDYSIGRVVEFLSRMYSVSEDIVEKKIKGLL